MQNKSNFIVTADKETADKLVLRGFQLISNSDSVYTFLNQPPKKFTFDNVDKKKVVYTNSLNI